MNTDHEQDDLWELMGRARKPEPSPFFSRNVLREVRGLRQERRSVFASLLLRWQPVMAAIALAAICGGAWSVQHQRHAEENRQLIAMAETVLKSPDYLVINDLDELIAAEKNAAWLSPDVH